MIIISAKDEDVVINESEIFLASHQKDKAQVNVIRNDGTEVIIKNVNNLNVVADNPVNWQSRPRENDGTPETQWQTESKDKIIKR